MAMVRVPGSSSHIEYKNYSFLITERPTDIIMQSYIDDLKKYGVTNIVRVCEPTYATDKLEQNGIGVIDLSFSDGSPPPQEVIDSWFDLLRTKYHGHPGSTVAVHCVAGLGRAPVLVALALMELGMKYEDAVELIRAKRRGAINAKQLGFLEKYKSKARLKNSKGSESSCTIS